MKRVSFISIFGLWILLYSSIPLAVSGDKLPIIDGKEVVATVNEEPITMEQYIKALESVHTEEAEEKNVTKVDYSKILTRLINTRLIIQEGRNIGLDELPEIEKMVETYEKQTLQGMLLQQQVRDIEVDVSKVEKIYKSIVEEVKLQSVILEEEDEARKMEEQIMGGGDFEEIAKGLIERGKARGSTEGEYMKRKDLQPQVADSLSKMETGQVSPITRVSAGFALFKLADTRFPEDQGAREEARKQFLKSKRHETIENYSEKLKEKYVKVDEELLGSIDFETSAESFQKLRGDGRALAQIEGEKSVTVGDLAMALEGKFFHGVDRAIKNKSINKRKIPAFENLVRKRVLLKEAFKEGIDKTKRYKEAIKEYENSVIFNAFVQRVVAPDIKTGNEELKRFYNDHIDEFTTPKMTRIREIIFEKRDNAEAAISKLKKGTDFGWLLANSENQVDKGRKDLLHFEGKLLANISLPEGLQKVLSGAKQGDYKLYESPEGHYYVLFIQDLIPPKTESFEKVRGKITEKIFIEKLKTSVDEWADKLRGFYEVKIYATDLKD